MTPGEIFSATCNASGTEATGTTGPYRETSSGLVRVEIKGPPDKQAEIQHPLTNFTARIVADISRDDGAETTRAFEIEARIGERSVTLHRAGRSIRGKAMADRANGRAGRIPSVRLAGRGGRGLLRVPAEALKKLAQSDSGERGE